MLELFNTKRKKYIGWGKQITRNKELAEDAFSRALILWHYNRTAAVENPEAYFARIYYKQLFNVMRKEKRIRNSEQEYKKYLEETPAETELPALPNVPDNLAYEKLLWNAIVANPSLNLKELAEILNMRHSSVKVYFHNLRKAYKEGGKSA